MIYQKGHGIPESLLSEVKKVTRMFFQLPYEEKIKIKLTPDSGYRFVEENRMLFFTRVNSQIFC